MFIKITHYGYFEKEGKKIYGLFNHNIPLNTTIIEEREVLYPEEGYILVDKLTGEKHSAVYLKNFDCEENYIEMENQDYENYPTY